jgi:hypothetical protein
MYARQFGRLCDIWHQRHSQYRKDANRTYQATPASAGTPGLHGLLPLINMSKHADPSGGPGARQWLVGGNAVERYQPPHRETTYRIGFDHDLGRWPVAS